MDRAWKLTLPEGPIRVPVVRASAADDDEETELKIEAIFGDTWAATRADARALGWA